MRLQPFTAYLHIVHDPWLNRLDIQLSSWVVHVILSSTPAVYSGTGVQSLVQEIEQAAAEAGIIPPLQIDTAEAKSPIDAILVNTHYGDHLHAPTILTFTGDWTSLHPSPLLPKYLILSASKATTSWTF